jgi:H+-transporting ATPase
MEHATSMKFETAPVGATDSNERPKTLGPAAIAAELSKLGTSVHGLTAEEARQRLAKDGPNAIVAKEEPLWHKAVAYFWGPIPWMIEAAALISLLRSDWPDFF